MISPNSCKPKIIIIIIIIKIESQEVIITNKRKSAVKNTPWCVKAAALFKASDAGCNYVNVLVLIKPNDCVFSYS